MSRKRKTYPKPKTAMTTVAAPADLKRLAFVESAAVNTASYVTGSTAFAKACGYYTSAKETDALKVCPYPSDWHETSARFSRGLALRVAILLPDASRARGYHPFARARPPRLHPSQTVQKRVRRFRLTPSLFIPPPSTAPQGSLTKIEDLIKAYGAPVVSKVQEKYPTYMTTVDAKVCPLPRANPAVPASRARSELSPLSRYFF